MSLAGMKTALELRASSDMRDVSSETVRAVLARPPESATERNVMVTASPTANSKIARMLKPMTASMREYPRRRKRLLILMRLNHHAPADWRQGPNTRAAVSAVDPFVGPTVEVARRLIGAKLERILPPGEPDGGSLASGRIVETEAYLPNIDPACHAYRGLTQRTGSLFGRPGRAYVYFIYGVHYCLNVVTEPPGTGAAVLVRAVEPLEGISAMQRRRPGAPVWALASGPGNVCRAFSIGRECDGVDLREGSLRIVFRAEAEIDKIAVTTRVGLSVAAQWPLRFYDPLSSSVSRLSARERGR